MSRVAQYLQEHIDGEILSDKRSKKYFATDASVFTADPEFIIYPRSTSDVRKVNRFAWQLAEKGKILPITARGKGTDLSGAAVGEGIILVFPAHMKKLMELDTAKGTFVVQPGMNYLNLQNTLHSHNRFLPPFPSSIDYATIGGAIANNSAGEKTVKYGST